MSLHHYYLYEDDTCLIKSKCQMMYTPSRGSHAPPIQCEFCQHLNEYHTLLVQTKLCRLRENSQNAFKIQLFPKFDQETLSLSQPFAS